MAVFDESYMLSRKQVHNIDIPPARNLLSATNKFLCAGQVGWGISWYIDDVLVPELIVERGSTYTFIIEGGTDADNLAQFHPFYITSSMSGGRLQNEADVRAVRKVKGG